MTKILHIIANPKEEDKSYSRKLAKEFLGEYVKNNPNDRTETLNLYDEEIPYLVEADLQATVIKHGENLTEEEKQKMRLKDRFIAQLKGSDKIVIAFPMWNFGIPAILKAYIDHISVAGKTFQYGPNGPEGLLKDKKICFITARGGDYTKMPDLELGCKYLKKIFGFLGVTDQIELIIEGTAMANEMENRWAKAVEEAKEKAKTF